MGHYCWVKCCTSDSRDKTSKKKSFHRIPAVIKREGEATFRLSLERRQLWIARIGREIPPTPYSFICSEHFVNGKPSKLYEQSSPDWAPSLKLTPPENAEPKPKKQKKSATKRRRVEVKNAAEALVDLSNTEERKVCVFYLRGKCDRKNDTEMEDLKKQVQQLQEQNEELKRQLKAAQWTLDALEDDNERVQFYTGLSSFAALKSLYDLIEPNIPISPDRRLLKCQQLLITLMKLKLDLTFKDLAYRFKTLLPIVKRTFHEMLEILYVRMDFIVFWPDRQDFLEKLPDTFLTIFGKCVSVLIDCFEVKVEAEPTPPEKKPRLPQLKDPHCHVFRYLLGISPRGAVNFISKGYSPWENDKSIAEKCGLLEKLLPGDAVLTDKGFDISECMKNIGGKYRKTKKGKQLSPFDEERAQKLTNLKTHIEGVVGLVRAKYTILQSTLPREYLQTDKANQSVIDKIIFICCALSNMRETVIPID